jgi:hypothetical protein
MSERGEIQALISTVAYGSVFAIGKAAEELRQRFDTKNTRIAELEQDNAALHARMAKLDALVAHHRDDHHGKVYEEIAAALLATKREMK